MIRHLSLLAAVLIISSLGFAQLEDKKAGKIEAENPAVPSQKPATAPTSSTKKPLVPGEVDLQFLNGSTVHMVITSDNLEVATIYGKLAIPIKDIRSIEFGIHTSADTAAKIKLHIANLGSKSFRERELATTELTQIGPMSYPALLTASQSLDLEIANRAKDLIKGLQATHSKKDLKTTDEDKIVTPTFTVVGRIQTPSIKAKADYFGEISLSLDDMRALKSSTNVVNEMEVEIEATKYANMGIWMDTKFRFDGKTAALITAKGLIDTCPQNAGQNMVGPNGHNQGRAINQMRMNMRKLGAIINPQIHSGMLIGKVGESGEPFMVGDRFEGVIEEEGNLYLHIGPSMFGCPSVGNYEVKISRK